ncbi:glycosyltransferase [Psychromonas ossibalaenae]|uniref:glycosyltransferase n=1 Tax=Psychromonas ossibalaenae TaxID=444922 RepID=UPI0003A59B49|nr:glycosyl transferase family 1 [Psychromonas ossibalaenae]
MCEYTISPSKINKINGVLNYIYLLTTLFCKRNHYEKIHFIWSVFLLIELPFFLVLKRKIIFTYHNDVPHSYPQKRYFPYLLIMKIAKKIVFVSNYTQRNFINNYGEHKYNFLLQHGVMPIGGVQASAVNKVTAVEKKIIFWGRVEEYKGVDLFDNYKLTVPIEIHGKWSKTLVPLKTLLSKKNSIYVIDRYLSTKELTDLISRNVVFILPYKDATQSGVLYTLLAYGKVFISSDVGENNEFLIKHGLKKLIFDRDNEESVLNAVRYAIENYMDIQGKMLAIRNEYSWEAILTNRVVSELYDE